MIPRGRERPAIIGDGLTARLRRAYACLWEWRPRRDGQLQTAGHRPEGGAPTQGDNRCVTPTASISCELTQRIQHAITQAGGWIGFDRFMAMTLYEPGLGYYTNRLQKFGAMPASGSDFVTAPGLTPLFGQTLAVQVQQALQATGTAEGWEFGAGTGVVTKKILKNYIMKKSWRLL